MDLDHINERFQSCSTLLQALLLVNVLSLPAGKILIRKGEVKGVLEFEKSKINRVSIPNSGLVSSAALDILVTLKNAQCGFVPADNEAEIEALESLPDALEVESAKGETVSRPGAESPSQTGIRRALVLELLRRSTVDEAAEFAQVSGKLAEPGVDDVAVSTVPEYDPNESGLKVISRLGFRLAEAAESAPSEQSVEEALTECDSLLDALLTLGSLGVQGGVLQLSTKYVKGQIEFRNKKLTQAMIPETGRSGKDALKLLMVLSGVSFRYVAPAKGRSSGKGLTGAMGVSAREQGDTNQSYSKALAAYRASNTKGLLKHERRFEDEEPAAPPAPEAEESFLPAAQLLQEGPGASLSDTGSLRTSESLPGLFAADEPAYPKAVALARAGFVWESRGSAYQQGGSSGINNTTTSSLVAIEAEISPTSKAVRKYVLPLVVAVLCLAIFTVPSMLWQSGNSRYDRSDQLRKMASESFDSMDDGNAIRRGNFVAAAPMVAAPVAAATAAGALPSDVEKPEDAKKDPSDSREFSLADSAATLPRLEELIYKYIAQKKFRRARDLALAAIRSNYATAEDRQRFFGLYRQCLHKQG